MTCQGFWKKHPLLAKTLKKTSSLAIGTPVSSWCNVMFITRWSSSRAPSSECVYHLKLAQSLSGWMTKTNLCATIDHTYSMARETAVALKYIN